MKKPFLAAALITAVLPLIVMAADPAVDPTPRLEVNIAHDIDRVRFSRDGRFLITLNSRSFRIYDADSMRLLRTVTAPFVSPDSALMPDGSAYCQSRMSKVESISLIDGSITSVSPSGGECLAFSPDGTSIAMEYMNTAFFVSYPDGKKGPSFSGLGEDIKSALYSHNGSLAAFGTWNSGGKLHLYSVKGGTMTRLGGTFSGHSGDILDMCFSEDDSLLAVSDSAGSVIVWNTSDGKIRQSFSLPGKDPGINVHIKNEQSPVKIITGKRLFLTGEIGTGILSKGKETPIYCKYFSKAAFSPDGNFFAATMETNALPLLYRIDDFALLSEQNTKTLARIETCAVSGDGSLCAYEQKDRIYAFNTRTGEYLDLANLPDSPFRVAINPDKMLIAYDKYQKIQLYDMKQKKALMTKDIGVNGLDTLDISADGQYIVCAKIISPDYDVEARRIECSGGNTRSLSTGTWIQSDRRGIESTTVSPDGRFAVCMPLREKCIIFDFRNLRQEVCKVSDTKISHLRGDAQLLTDPDFIKAVPNIYFSTANYGSGMIDFSGAAVRKISSAGSVSRCLTPDRKKLLLGFDDGSIRIYDVPSMNLAGTVAAGKSGFGAIHPDGRYFGSTPDILSLLHWVVGNEAVALKDFGQQFFTPGILSEILTGRAAASDTIKKEKPPVSVKRQLIGKVFLIEGNNVIVASTQSGTLARGKKLFVVPDDGGAVELSISMPMHTSAKCAIKDPAKKKTIRKGMPVFRE